MIDMKIHKTEAKNLRKGFLSVDSLTITHDTFDGQSLTVDREILERGNAVAVLAYDPALDKVLLIRQMLPGVVAHNLKNNTQKDPFPYQVVAGGVEETSTSAYEDAAIRESKEEAGLSISHLIKGYSFMPSPGGSSERLQTYIAITDLSQAGGIFGLASENENIKAEVLEAQRAIDLLDEGLIEAGPAVICLSYFARHHEKLKSIR